MKTFLIDYSFTNFECLSEQARAQSWDLNFLQIEKGRFRARITQYVSDNVLFSRAFFNRRLKQNGAPPKGLWTFAIPAYPGLQMNFKGHEINSQNIIIYPPGSEIECLTYNVFDMLTFSISEHDLKLFCQKGKFTKILNFCKGKDLIKSDKIAIENLRYTLNQLFADLNQYGITSNRDAIRLYSKKQIFNDLFNAIVLCENNEKSSFRLRDGAFKQAIACVSVHAKEGLTVKGLTYQTGVSQRTLEYVFKENLGISPKQYIRAYRLNQVNRELSRKENFERSITEIAFNWGFLHMGQFSRDYKQMFKELPSETRKQMVMPTRYILGASPSK